MTSLKPKPKENRPITSIIEHSAFIPGAVIAGSLLIVATVFGVIKLVGGRKKKPEKPKSTQLDS